MAEPLRVAADHTIYCSRSECEVHQHVGHETYRRARLPVGWSKLTEYGANGAATEGAFCSTECVMMWCAKQEPPTIIDTGDSDGTA